MAIDVGMVLTVTSEVIAKLLEDAARAHPEECCGLLLGQGEHIEEARPSANVAFDRTIRFEIDPAVLLKAHREARNGGQQVLGYYHSHPTGSESPSVTDRELAGRDGRVWAIIASGRVAFWLDHAEGFAAAEWVLSGS